MKIFVDENIPLITVKELVQQGFDAHREEPHYGILIIRLKQPSRLKIHQRVMQAIKKYSKKEWHGFMVVMRDTVQSSWKSHYKK